MFNIGVILQIVGIIVALGSMEFTLFSKGYEEIRSAYINAYRRLLSETHQLEQKGLVIPEANLARWAFKFRGTRQVVFGVAINPRLRFLTVFGYLFHVGLDLMPLAFVMILILNRQMNISGWLFFVTGLFSILWLLGVMMNIRSRRKLIRNHQNNMNKRVIYLVFQVAFANIKRPIINFWKAFLLVMDFVGMLPALFIPSRVLPLSTTHERRRYLLNVGSLYIIIGLLLQLLSK